MEVREAKTIKVPPGQAYGPRSKELVAKIRELDLREHMLPVTGL
jgi:FKBP-type peptidyl-prolyl cis-trans isomerase 2